MMTDYVTYKHCRVTGSTNLIPFFEMKTALAGAFVKSESEFEKEKQYPLTVAFCPFSTLVQVNEVLDAELLFRNYFYKTGTIKTLANHFEGLANTLKEVGGKSVLEIGCNDCSMLRHLVGSTYATILGVDPSNVAKESVPEGVGLINDFFTAELAEKILKEQGRFDAISASNCFAHIENIDGTAYGIERLLSRNGVAIIEVHWLGTLIGNLQFPFIYHEHMYYWSLHALNCLLQRNGLEVFHVERNSIHGGSIRYYIAHMGIKAIAESVGELAMQEKAMGLLEAKTFLDFQNRVNELRDKTMFQLETLRRFGRKVYGYGASGQANTMMAYYGITKEHIPLIVDDSPLRAGCWTPNNHIPIVNSDILKTDPPDFIFLFAYTFADEIRKRNRDLKCRWIIPLPEFRIVD